MKYICDTNFIIRYLIADDPTTFDKAKEIFDQVKIGKISLIIEQAVFTEVIFVLSSFYKVPKNEIAKILIELLSYKGIVSDKTVELLALNYYAQQNLHIVDCLLLAQSNVTNINILSFDQQLNSISNLI